jgi:hypothetical protein
MMFEITIATQAKKFAIRYIKDRLASHLTLTYQGHIYTTRLKVLRLCSRSYICVLGPSKPPGKRQQRDKPGDDNRIIHILGCNRIRRWEKQEDTNEDRPDNCDIVDWLPPFPQVEGPLGYGRFVLEELASGNDCDV